MIKCLKWFGLFVCFFLLYCCRLKIAKSINTGFVRVAGCLTGKVLVPQWKYFFIQYLKPEVSAVIQWQVLSPRLDPLGQLGPFCVVLPCWTSFVKRYFFFSTYPIQAHKQAEAYHSCHRAKSRVHPEHIETDNHWHLHPGPGITN